MPSHSMNSIEGNSFCNEGVNFKGKESFFTSLFPKISICIQGIKPLLLINSFSATLLNTYSKKNNIMIEISQLKQIRRLLNITQSDFARLAHVSQSMIAKIEAGKLDPSYSNAKKISEAIERMKHEKEPTVKEIMVKKVISMETKDLLKDAIRIFNKYGISQIPVMKGSNIAGILYESTLLEKAAEPNFAKMTAEEAMVEAPPTVSEDTKVSAVSNLLKYFPVVLVTKKGDLTGIVTKADILKNLI